MGVLACGNPLFGSSAAPPDLHNGQSPDGAKRGQTRIILSYGKDNNLDMFVCPVNPFLVHYGPCDVKETAVTSCMARLAEEDARILEYNEQGHYIWSDLQSVADDNSVHIDTSGALLKRIMELVLAGEGNKRRFNLSPNTIVTTDTPGVTYKLDGCFLEIPRRVELLQNWDITVPVVIKPNGHKMLGEFIHPQILAACYHVLVDDLRRMWVYGLSFEGPMVSIWYFSRSHSVKSDAFNWIQNPRTLVHVLLAFASATPMQLGLDKAVHIGPLGNNNLPSFVFELPGNDGAPVFFKTIKSFKSEPLIRIAAQRTRVFKVTQVTAADGKQEVSGKRVVLKDVWLDASDKHRKTEAENMDAIFKAVDAFVEGALNAEIKLELESKVDCTREELLSDAATVARLTMQFIRRDTRFSAFDDAAKTRLWNHLTDKKYRSLFLTKLYAWKGETITGVCPDASRSPKMFYPWPIYEQRLLDLLEEEYQNDRARNTTNTSLRTQSLHRDEAQGENHNSRHFPPKRQLRFIYEEVCTTLKNLDTLGDVIDVLCQTVNALHILFAAGWVHRDISPNNIMACRTSKAHPWVIKLADLEFARPMIGPESTPRTETIIGTPFFIPVEVQAQKHFFQRYLLDTGLLVDYTGTNLAMILGLDQSSEAYKSLSRLKEIPVQYFEIPLANAIWHKAAVRRQAVVHNYQHDLESVWWVLLWIITCRVGCSESAAVATRLFKRDAKEFKARERQFSKYLSAIGDALLTGLQHFSLPADILRARMYRDYMVRPIVGHLELPESYSGIHALFATQLRELQATEGPWRTVRLEGNRRDDAETDSLVPPILLGKRNRDAFGS